MVPSEAALGTKTGGRLDDPVCLGFVGAGGGFADIRDAAGVVNVSGTFSSKRWSKEISGDGGVNSRVSPVTSSSESSVGWISLNVWKASSSALAASFSCLFFNSSASRRL